MVGLVDTDAGDPRVPVERAMSAPGWALEVSVGGRDASRGRMALLLHVDARA